MNERLREAFAQVRAEEQLKNSTRAFLYAKTNGYGSKTRGRLHLMSAHAYAYAAACACLFLMLFGIRSLYFTPAASISIDINPSLELGVNRFDRVISIDSFNEDGQELSKMLNVRFKNYTDAITEILNNDKVEALLSGDEIMTITVTGPDETRSTQILSTVEATTAHHKNTYYYSAPYEATEAAHEAGFSCGKYQTFLEAQTLDSDLTQEAAHGMSMRELRELIDILSDDAGEEPPYSGAQGGSHHGNGNGYGNGNGMSGSHGYSYGVGHRGGHE